MHIFFLDVDRVAGNSKQILLDKGMKITSSYFYFLFQFFSIFCNIDE